MRELLTSLLLLIWPLLIAGQSLSVASFDMDPSDLTALNESSKVIDDNGNLCALIKVETTQKGFSFDGGTIGIVKVDESQPGEIWVFVPADLRRITIRHKDLGVLRDYYFPEVLGRGRTYIMKLISGTVVTSIQQTVNSQYLVIHYSPKEAMVEIDGEIIEGENGTAMKRVKFGKHTFRVSMADYHPEAGQVMVNDPNAKVEQTIQLKPAYGWIKIVENTTNRDASVYIDNTFCGHIPYKSGNISSGQHDLRVVKSKYLTYRKQVFVTDGKVTEVTPSLTANFETVTFRMDGNPEVWANNERIGTGNCTAELEPGEYVIETRLPSHLTQTKVINVRIGDKTPVNLVSPIPIFGRIDISSKPLNSVIYMDGKEVGRTPLFMQEVLIGEHTIKIKGANKEDLEKRVVVKEGETITIDESLKDKPITYQVGRPVDGSKSKTSGTSDDNVGSYTYTKKDNPMMSCLGKNYSLGGKTISKYEAESLFKRYCPDEYRRYRNARNADVAGAVLACAGLLTMTCSYFFIDGKSETWVYFLAGGGAGVIIGSLMFCAPTVQRRNECVSAYNQRRNTSASLPATGVKLALQGSRDGIGITLKF